MKLFKHWKTTTAGLTVGFFSVMLWMGKIDVTQWAEGLGLVTTIVGILAKDWDKTNEA